jgi:hypothetical protein
VPASTLRDFRSAPADRAPRCPLGTADQERHNPVERRSARTRSADLGQGWVGRTSPPQQPLSGPHFVRRRGRVSTFGGSARRSSGRRSGESVPPSPALGRSTLRGARPDQSYRGNDLSEKFMVHARMAMGACAVVDSIVVPLEQQMTSVGALAVPGLTLHDHALVRAGELGGRPPTGGRRCTEWAGYPPRGEPRRSGGPRLCRRRRRSQVVHRRH